MPTAANMTEAANLSYAQMSIVWEALTLRTAYANFIADCKVLLDDNVPSERTVGNWLTPMRALSEVIDLPGGSSVSINLFSKAAEYLFRFCYAAATARAQNRISVATNTALLAAWNARFGT